jgi:hypothetical protein
MDAATAALGQQLLQEGLNSWQFDAAQMQAEVAQFHQYTLSHPPSQEECAATAVGIHTRAKEREGNMAYAKEQREAQARMIDSTRIRTANCTRIGTQTFCNGY